MFPYLRQSTQAQVWLDVQFSDFRMLADVRHIVSQNGVKFMTCCLLAQLYPTLRIAVMLLNRIYVRQD